MSGGVREGRTPLALFIMLRPTYVKAERNKHEEIGKGAKENED